MTNYNYYEAIFNDVCAHINENIDIIDYIEDGELDREELENKLNDDCWVDDSVTGNASGSYYCNAHKAQEAVSDNMDTLVAALEEFGDDPDSYKQALKSPEFADVTIRCYYLAR
ncbi:MAG: hypothetical protein IJ740_18890 [Ruminococcus sp.]|nr:hypothetical protein [Ruminococcus sp.]MBR1752909.1 hypothetical protein [Ruminococcus sp.]